MAGCRWAMRAMLTAIQMVESHMRHAVRASSIIIRSQLANNGSCVLRKKARPSPGTLSALFIVYSGEYLSGACIPTKVAQK